MIGVPFTGSTIVALITENWVTLLSRRSDMIRSSTYRLPMLATTVLILAFASAAQAQVKPAMVRDISTAQPVDGYCNSTYDVSLTLEKCQLYVVPPGKRLVVESVSYYIRLGVNGTLNVVSVLWFGYDDCPTCGNFFFNAKAVAIAPVETYSISNYRIYAGSQMTRLYLEENQSFVAQFIFTPGGGTNYPQHFSFSGYLVDK
jgi:hypothetical protein